MSTVCESSPWKNESDRRATVAQWRVMRELEIPIWDPKNEAATKRLEELLENSKIGQSPEA